VDNVRVVERGSGLGFLHEAAAPVGVIRRSRQQQLHRYGALQPRVARTINFTHASGANRGRYFVGAQAGSGS
jgi:hypothetical protein